MREKLEIVQAKPWTFRDDIRVKTYADGSTEEIYMIYLIFDCRAANRTVELNDEFEDHALVRAGEFGSYDLNAATRTTLAAKGLIDA